MGLRSGDWAGHGRSFTPRVLMCSLVTIEVWQVALSCWRTMSHPYNSFMEGMRILSRVWQYLSESMVPTTISRGVVPKLLMPPHTMIDGANLLISWRGVLPTLTNIFRMLAWDWNRASSEKTTPFQSQSLCCRHQASRASLCRWVRTGALRGLFLTKPSFSRSRPTLHLEMVVPTVSSIRLASCLLLASGFFMASWCRRSVTGCFFRVRSFLFSF